MSIESEISDQVCKDFPAEEVPRMLERLESLSEDARTLRCIVFAARGHPWYFDFLCRLAKVDYPDVISAAEYERLRERLYDFNKPIPEARIDVDRCPSPNVLRK
jgi:hypothetical protein